MKERGSVIGHVGLDITQWLTRPVSRKHLPEINVQLYSSEIIAGKHISK